MSDSVGSYSLSTFTTPTQGQKPIPSAVFRGNYNALRDKLVGHDGDAGLHVQHVVSGALPGTGTGSHATYVTTDTGRVYCDLTNGQPLTEIAYAPITRSSGVHAVPGGDVGLPTTGGAGFFVLYATTTSNAVAWARAYYDPAAAKPVIIDRSATSGALWFSTPAESSGTTIGLHNGSGGSLTYTVVIQRVI
jgi:hypothetical protein